MRKTVTFLFSLLFAAMYLPQQSLAGDPMDGPQAKTVKALIEQNAKLREAIISDFGHDESVMCMALYPMASGFMKSGMVQDYGLGDLALTMMVQFSLYRATAPGADHTADLQFASKLQAEWSAAPMKMVQASVDCMTKTANALAKSK